MYGSLEFNNDVISRFGRFIPDLEEDSMMMHTQMGYLADGVRDGLDCAPEILSFVEGLLHIEDAHPEIENSVAISFLEIEELPGLGLETSIPPTIHRILKEQQKRWRDAKNT